MATRYVVIPFARAVAKVKKGPGMSPEERRIENAKREKQNLARRNYISHVKDNEWGLKQSHKHSFQVFVYPSKLRPVPKDGAVLYVQAHGYTNTGTAIGCDGGIGSVTAEQLVDRLIEMGLNPDLKNVTIKVWACYSGFDFAKALYDKLVQKHNGKFPGLCVDGYTGSTKLGSNQKTVKQELLDNQLIAPWVLESQIKDQIQQRTTPGMSETDTARIKLEVREDFANRTMTKIQRAKDARVRYGAHI